MTIRSFLSSSLILLCASSAHAAATNIEVRDCNGTVRAVEEIGEGSTAAISFSIVDERGAAVSNSHASLRNRVSGQALLIQAPNGEATTSELSSGSWEVCPMDRVNHKLGEVSITSSSSNRLTALAVGAAAIGGTITTIALSNNGGGSSGAVSEGSTLVSTSANTTAAVNKPSSSVASTSAKPGGSGNDYCSACSSDAVRANGRECLNSERPDPISVFR